ncbi:MAG: acetylxylan esterase [Bryobacteraceae bacterium]|nr:acetylxylan esterase [Bryobacteraceae bacterium]
MNTSMKAILCVLPVVLAVGVAAQDFRALDPRLHGAPEQMLSSYLQQIAAQQLEERRHRVDAIRSKEDYEQRKTRLRTTALRILGGLNEPRTPLNLRRTGTLDRGDYRVEKIVYESRPRYYVTANLYIPQKGNGPFPAILHPLGHSITGKNRAFYQRLSIGLVKQGFVVLTYDPIGQGERRIFWDADLADSKVGGPTQEHSMVGWQSLLAGETVARHRIWDGIRSVDLLESLKEVDRNRIGVTGCSGGGTLTTYIAALDDRMKAAAPACYISSWDEQLKGTGPQDAEQQFPDQLREGLNHSDWIGLAAPKPYLIVNTDQDFFPLEGARKTFAEMKRIYELYDAAVKVEWFHEPGGHGTPTASREAIYAWMNRWLRGEPGPVKEPSMVFEHEEDLNATQTGQVATSLGGETASTDNIRRFRDRLPPRPEKPDAARIRAEVLRLTRYKPATVPLNLSRGAAIDRSGHRIEMLTYRSEEGLIVPAALVTPAQPRAGRVALLVDSRGKSAALAADGDVLQLAQLGYTVLAIDPAGIGETAFQRHAAAPWSSPQLTFLALMVGRPLIGIRMNDILRGIDALKELNVGMTEGVLGVARGYIGTTLLHAAAIDSRLSRLIVEGNLVSYQAVGAAPIHRNIDDLVLPGVLGRYDLPDLVAAVAPRPVTLRNLISPTGRALFRAEMQDAYAYPLRVANADVGLRNGNEKLTDAYPFLR